MHLNSIFSAVLTLIYLFHVSFLMAIDPDDLVRSSEVILTQPNLQQLLDKLPIPKGYQSQEPVFVSSTEIREKSHLALSRLPQNDKARTLIGVSGFELLTLANIRHNIDTIVALDINPKVIQFWNDIIQIIRNQPDHKTAYRDIRNYISENAEFLFERSAAITIIGLHQNFSGAKNAVNILLQDIQTGTLSREMIYKHKSEIKKTALWMLSSFEKDLKDPSYWLYSQSSYDYIRRIALNNRILTKEVDFTDPKSINHISKFLQAERLTIDLLFVSNLAYECFKSAPIVAENIAMLAKKNGVDKFLLIYATMKGDACSPEQKILIVGPNSLKKNDEELAGVFLQKILKLQ